MFHCFFHRALTRLVHEVSYSIVRACRWVHAEQGTDILHVHFAHLFRLPLLECYYFLKPAIPEGIRFLLRHWYALPLKWLAAGSWPIRAASAITPTGWPGWPGGNIVRVRAHA